MFKSIIKWATMALASLLFLSSPALAKDYKAGGITVDEMLAEVKTFSKNAAIAVDTSTKEKYIKATVDDTDVSYTVWMYECEQERCKSVQFHFSFNGDPKKVSDWNKNYRFARAYVSGTDLIHLEYDIDVEAGTNSAILNKAYKRFLLVALAGVTFWDDTPAKK